ncbi:MAG: response regulator [Okeania sp. SIO3I5]|uniref:ATP-binding response regulator n=1 Tax=Okeania sp. SIO3I5 TaxID=2607805 RepID=UPI0013BCE0F0|nr:ATP-binding protein [Okeania sp. SIO3I5]NEQ40000.1 response regulator [Okeania sp. SIO3I5]
MKIKKNSQQQENFSTFPDSSIESPSPILIFGHWLDCLQIGQKIGVGYIVGLSVAIIGIITGWVMGNNLRHEALEGLEHTQEEIKNFQNLQSTFLKTKIAKQQLISLIDQPKKFTQEISLVLVTAREIEKSWQQFKTTQADQDHLKEEHHVMIDNFIKTYKDVPKAYVQQLDTLLVELNSLALEYPQEQKIAYELVIDFIKSPTVIQFQEASSAINEIIKVSYLEVLEASESLSKAEKLSRKIIAISIFTSVAIAIFLAIIISRTITHPIRELRKFAEKVREEGDLTLRAPVLTKDEIGVLATAFNYAIERIEASVNTANKANLAKSKFLANMSHELRTPLNGIMGYAQILQRSKSLNKFEINQVEIIYNCSCHLLTLINDVLDLSKIEADKMELYPIQFHFPSFLQGVVEMCQIKAELKGISFIYETNHKLIGVYADQKRLRQVLINLLGNAIKFTDDGTVTFSVSSIDDYIRFEVRDTGIGMTPEELERIFMAFEQVGDKNQSEGTGLGLAISQKITQLMGSSIQVESHLDFGSRFWFDLTLPIATEWATAESYDSKGEIVGIKGISPKIIVVDDKWENRSVIVNLLKPIGFQVQEAEDGEDSWEKIQLFHPDLIITDLVMPVLDGFEMIQRIRESENFQASLIVASSASIYEIDKDKCLEIGADDFLPKPVEVVELLKILKKHLNLEWVYQGEVEVKSTLEAEITATELVPPSTKVLEKLYDLALKGNFKAIIKEANSLESIDPKFVPFARKIYQLAKEFQDREIITLIESLGVLT